jgi:hypothetical protein
MPESVEVVLKYVEIGAGLPTVTPYEALINQATVNFKTKNLTDNEVPYENVTLKTAQACVADIDGKTKTTFYLTAIPAAWKEKVFDEFLATESDELNIVDFADATVTFSGYDSVAGREVRAVGTFPVEFGNFYDDPRRFGK